MGVLDRLAGWWLEKSTTNSANPASWFVDWVRGGQESAAGIAISQMRALQDTTCMACVSIRAGDLAKLPVHVFRTKDDGGQEIVKGHPLERVLKKPNKWQTRLEFVEMMQSALLLKGNAYAVIQRNNRAAPLAMIPVAPDQITVFHDGDDLFYKWTANNDFESAALSSFPNPIPASDMLHLRWMSMNGLLGLSRMSLARDALGLSLALEEHSSRLFANGARPGGVLRTDKRLGDEAFKRLKAQWLEYTGVENTGKTPILEEGLEWIREAMTSVESETISARRLQTEQIATVFDVPLHRLGIAPDGGATAIIQAHQMYLNNTLSTDAERWESKLGDIFGLSSDMYVEFDLDYFNRADIQTRMNAYRVGIIGSVYKPNEARNKEGLGSVPHGDDVLQAANVVPLGTMPATPGAAGPGSDTTGAPAAGGDGDPAGVDPV